MSGLSTHASLLSRVRDAGDDDAWAEFEQRYRDLILRYCFRRGLQYWDAEDVRQAVMANLLGAMKRFRYDRERGSFRGCLGVAVHHAIARHFRRPIPDAGGPSPDELAAVEDPRDGGREAWDREWRDHHLRLAVEHVRRDTRPATWRICERLLDGLDVRAVAASLSVTEDAVYKAGQRFRRRLRERLAEQLRDEEAPARDTP